MCRYPCVVLGIAMLAGVLQPSAQGQNPGLTVSPTSLYFSGFVNGTAPARQALTITARNATQYRVSSVGQTNRGSWLAVTPTGAVSGSQNLSVTVNLTGLAPATYNGTISLARAGATSTVPVTLVVTGITVSPTSLQFTGEVNGAAPPSKTIAVSATRQLTFTATPTGQSGGRNWLTVSPSGSQTTNRNLTVTANQRGLAAGTYGGSVAVVSNATTITVPITFVVGGSSGTPTSAYKLIGWNDLGMHCMDGKDFSVFAVLPPFNTIHSHLIDPNGRLVLSDIGYTVTYQAISDPLTKTINTTSASKTNFWQHAAALGFGTLSPDVGLKGFAMPGSANTPQAMVFSSTDNTWLATGVPVVPYPDGASSNSANYFPMMRLVARNSLGTMLASTDIVLPVSDEMTCSVCHASNTGTAAAKPATGWVNHTDPAKDVKLNILRKHDDRFKDNAMFQAAAAQLKFNPAGLEATSAARPFLCASCHGSNALEMPGVSGIPSLTASMHGMHANVTDPDTNQTLEQSLVRDSCYRCHPGPKTQCLRGAMGTLKTSAGRNAIDCQGCHGSISAVAVNTRNGWLEEPNCQSCHTGTATSNNGQIAYTSVFSNGTTVRSAANQTFATTPNTPMNGISLYRFSSGHGGLQCEACHGSTHAEFAIATSNVNDNAQSTSLQGHTGVLAECTACHPSVPSTVTGGPHGLHPIGPVWVSRHPDVVESGGASQCQVCHGRDYRGTILSKTLADRTLNNRAFPKGTMIGCYSCHNGPSGG